MRKIVLTAIVILTVISSIAQKKEKQEPQSPYKFTDIKINDATPVKDQASSGTCWSYATLAQIESNLLREGKGEHDLAEMWIVRHSYFEKVVKYVRMHGEINLSAGGIGDYAFTVIAQHGIVPEEIYNGLHYGTDKNLHSEMDLAIKNYADAIICNPNRTLSTAWQKGLNGILDAYLGAVPENFTYRGKEYTPKSFARELEISKDNYFQITSFSHHPQWNRFTLEIPDNFSWLTFFNLPMDVMIESLDRALENGYTVCWGADVSEPGFQYNRGFAVLPATKVDDMPDSEKGKWSNMTDRERLAKIIKFDEPVAEINVTEELRQQWFDNYQTTDDHGMLIVGIAKDQNGNRFYKVKNSWTTGNVFQGYFYASLEYIKGKTLIMTIPSAMVDHEWFHY